jgi:hypothetical protein
MARRGHDSAEGVVGGLGSASRIAGTLATLTATNYLAWLGWDQRSDVGPGGAVSDQYEPWQIVGLAVGLAILAAVAGGTAGRRSRSPSSRR